MLAKLNVKCRGADPGHILTLLHDGARHPPQLLLFLRHPPLAPHHARGRPNLQRPQLQALFLPQDVHGIFSAIIAKDLGT
jgi:hypothetical protein